MTDIISTKKAAEELGMKGRELGAFVRTHPQFAPVRSDGFPPYYTPGLVEAIKEFREGVAAGTICEACGETKPTDHPDYAVAKATAHLRNQAGEEIAGDDEVPGKAPEGGDDGDGD